MSALRRPAEMCPGHVGHPVKKRPHAVPAEAARPGAPDLPRQVSTWPLSDVLICSRLFRELYTLVAGSSEVRYTERRSLTGITSVAWPQKTVKGLGSPGSTENRDPYTESGERRARV